MASISVQKVRDLTGITTGMASNAKLGSLIAITNAVFYSLTKKDLGHYIESLTQNVADVDLVIYGHLLGLSGKVWISGCGAAIDGERTYEIIDDDSIKIKTVTLAGGEKKGRMHPPREFEAQVYDQAVAVSPCPVYKISEICVSSQFGPSIYTEEAIVDPLNYAVRNTSQFNDTIEITEPIIVVRSRQGGFLNPQVQYRQRMARVRYYSGLDSALPLDLVQAIASSAQEMLANPSGFGGLLQSESVDYYSYSRASIKDLKEYPFSALATFMRYM